MCDEDTLVTAMGDGETRLDTLLSLTGAVTRSRAEKLIEDGLCRVGDAVQRKPGAKPRAGERVCLAMPAPAPARARPEALPLTVLYEDDALAVVIKPCGMVTHPAAGHEEGTLVNALLYHLDSLSGVGGEKRPGIVHRLDKDTSGLLLVAKNDAAHLSLSLQLSDRAMEKHYLALASGRFSDERGACDLPIGRSSADRKKMAVRPDGRAAHTQWRVLRQDARAALLDVRILTGRTHQIRVHLKACGHPILGDPIYGGAVASAAPRLMLHAWRLSFTHPETGARLTFEAPPDPIFGRVPAPERGEEAKP